MRILNVIMCLDSIGGGGSVERIYQLSRHLSLVGKDCTILTTKQGWDEEHILKLGKVKVVALPYISERFKIPLGLFGWLNKHILDYEIVHLAMNWTMINAITYLYLRYYNRPYVFSAMGWLTIDGRSKLIKHIYRNLFTKRMVRNAGVCIAVTKREVNDYVNFGVDPKRIVRIPNGINPESFCDKDDEAFRVRYGLDARPIILFIGRIDPIKGPDLLLRAFYGISESFPNYQLVIAGNDLGFLSNLKTLARSFGLEEKTRFLGHIGGKELSWAYHAANVFVIPSRYDTMTIVALGAAASGTPVLLTDRCDFGELQEAGGGLSVECSVKGLENGLRRLLSDPVQLKTIGRRAREFVISKYSWEQVCKQFIDVFQAASLPVYSCKDATSNRH